MEKDDIGYRDVDIDELSDEQVVRIFADSVQASTLRSLLRSVVRSTIAFSTLRSVARSAMRSPALSAMRSPARPPGR